MNDQSLSSPTLIDGRAFASALTGRIGTEVAELAGAGAGVPGLAVVLVGDDQASAVYVGAKHRATLAAGMASF